MAALLERDLGLDCSPRRLCAALRRQGGPALLLEGTGFAAQAWSPVVAVEAVPILEWRRRTAEDEAPLALLDEIIGGRRRRGGSAATGVAVLLGFDALSSMPPAGEEMLPDLVALAVDGGVRFPADGGAVFSHCRGDGARRSGIEARLERALTQIERDAPRPRRVAASRPTTSLNKQRYLRAVELVQHHIREGDIYQANLTQRFEIAHTGDPYALFLQLTEAVPAPRSAFFEIGDLAVASVSPETFLRVDVAGHVETLPIKGTRPRSIDPEEDAASARELQRSPKDRAELLMIVDLERNDLGRVCRTGSIRVDDLARLESFSAVHHLVARVRGVLEPGTTPGSLIRATFPGGSVTGAPKKRALEILRTLEPVSRNFYTGSLLWFGDDGSLESSILIRTVVLSNGRAYLGAGGGVVADSDPEGEWIESNHKARGLAQVLGFAPEEAS